MRIVSLHIGEPRTVHGASGDFITGGVKRPVERAMLRSDGFEGDGTASGNHGGPDRTVCVYPAGHYSWWKSVHGLTLPFGAFCENLTVDGAEEEEIRIGDTFRVGAALAQVTLPRDPCKTLDRINGIDSLAARARDSGRCGFHMRTLAEGMVEAGAPFDLVSRHPAGITVAAVLGLFHGRSRDAVLAERLLALPEFPEEGRKIIRGRLHA